MNMALFQSRYSICKPFCCHQITCCCCCWIVSVYLWARLRHTVALTLFSFSLVSSAHLRAVASGSLWTLTCAHMCVFTLETAPMCAPLMAATRNLLSQPTWSLTSSHTQKLKTTSESTPNQENDNMSIHWRIWPVSPLLDRQLMSRGLLCCEIRSPLCIVSR